MPRRCGRFARHGRGSPTSGSCERSPLHDRHVALGAKLARVRRLGRCRWSTAGGVLKEHAAVRERVGVFDVSHLGKVSGHRPGRRGPRQRCLTNDLGRIGAGQGAVHAVLRRRDRRHRRRPHRLPARRRPRLPDPQRRQLRRGGPPARARPRRTGVDGHRPARGLRRARRAGPALRRGARPARAAHRARLHVLRDRRATTACRADRLPHRLHRRARLRAGRRRPTSAAALWDALLEAGRGRRASQPCGLGARDTLRTEMGYPLHGQDISLDVTPVQARLGWAVGWSKPRVLGPGRCSPQEKAAGPARVLRGLVAAGPGHPAARACGCCSPRDVPVGEVTSGTFSPTLRKGVGLALLDAQVTDGAEVAVDVRGRREIFVLTRPPFVTSGRCEPDAAAMTHSMEPSGSSPSGLSRQAVWRWQLLRRRRRRGVRRARPVRTASSALHLAGRRRDAGSARPGASSSRPGVDAVTLLEGDREVYGPMSLQA